MRTALLTMALFAAFIACERRETAPVDASVRIEQPDQEMWKFSVTATDKGKLQAVINAGHMRRFSNRSLALFDEGVHIDFFDERGSAASVLTAQGGELDDNSGNVKIVGNVMVISDSGYTLHTEELYYYKDENRILSNVKVMVTTEEGDTLRGVGFESDTQMNDWRILQPYDGVVHKGADLRLESRREPAPSDSLSSVPDLEPPDSLAAE